MEDLELLNAIGWWALRKRRSYIRPAHYKSALHRNSFAVFWRYYSSPDEGDLKRFLRLSQTDLDLVLSILWDPTNADYPSLSKKQSDWLSIEQSFREAYTDQCFGVALLKKIWDNVLSSHRRTRHRVEGKTGDGAEEVEPDWKFWCATAFLRTVNTFSDKQIRATNATPSFLAKQTPSKSPISKKQKLDPEFERLMDAVENKRKMPPLAMEIAELLKQVEDGGNKRMQLECKRELRNFISKWEEHLLEAPEKPTETLSDTVCKKSVAEMSLKEYQDLLQDC